MKKKTIKKVSIKKLKKTVEKTAPDLSNVLVASAITNLSIYKATIKILGKTYEATGGTATEAIQNLKPSGVTKGVSILTVSKGDKKREKVLTHPQTFRLFSLSKLMREIALKQVSLIFGDL